MLISQGKSVLGGGDSKCKGPGVGVGGSVRGTVTGIEFTAHGFRRALCAPHQKSLGRCGTARTP